MGNILALKYRLGKLGLEVNYRAVEIGDELPGNTDMYFIGGGQDGEQKLIALDLIQKKKQLNKQIESGVALLAICGGYQLLGHSFTTGDGQRIPGIGLFPVATTAPSNSVKSRSVGNILIDCMIPELTGVRLVGFENHSGQTTFIEKVLRKDEKLSKNNDLDSAVKDFLINQSPSVRPLGKVVVGSGNNTQEKLEGCVYRSAIGTYLHGPCLPKNPELADWLIYQAIQGKVKREKLLRSKFRFNKIDDTIASIAKKQLIQRLTGGKK